MQYLGLDIGSSSIKAAVLDLDAVRPGEPVGTPCPAARGDLPERYFELNPDEVVRAVQSVMCRLPVGDCAGIVATTQMAGVLLVDAERRPLTNYLSWRDQRVLVPVAGKRTFFDELCGRMTPEHHAQLGGEFKPGASASLLAWLGEQGTLPADARPIGIGEYVLSCLCESEPCVEFTNALGALHLVERDWHWEVLERLGLSKLQWPRLIGPTEPVGEISIDGRRLPCYAAVGDHQCALLGTGLAADELSLNISTGSQISQLTDELQLGDYQSRTYFGDQWLNTVTHLPAGRSLNVLVDLLCELPRKLGHDLSDPWQYIHSAVENSTESDLEVDLAFFAGPMGNRGHLSGITVDNLTVGSLFRAAFRNMADNYAGCARRLSADQAWNRVVFSGGLPQKSAMLRDLIVECLATSCRVCMSSEDTLMGLLGRALVIEGKVSDFRGAADRLRQVANPRD